MRQLMQVSLISAAEGLPIIHHGRRRHRGIAEFRMPSHGRRASGGHIPPCGFKSIMEAHPRHLIGGDDRGRRLVGNRLRMGAAEQQQWGKQQSQNLDFLTG